MTVSESAPVGTSIGKIMAYDETSERMQKWTTASKAIQEHLTSLPIMRPKKE